jgi:hypothetical protein
VNTIDDTDYAPQPPEWLPDTQDDQEQPGWHDEALKARMDGIELPALGGQAALELTRELQELQRLKIEAAKGDLAVKTAVRPKEGKRSRKAAAAQKRLEPDRKRHGLPLLGEWAYLGSNSWLRKNGPTWFKPSREFDGRVQIAIKNAGYDSLLYGPDWKDDPILSQYPPRTNITEIEAVLDYMAVHCAVSGVMDAANYPNGILELAGARILNRGNYVPMNHSPCAMPACWQTWTYGLFNVQQERVMALTREWLRTVQGGDALMRGWFQPLVLALVSSSGGKGKGRFIHYCARMAGAAISEPLGKYIEGDDIGASVKLQAPVVDMSDSHIGANKAAKQLKFMKLVTEEVKDSRQ